jgi:sirohydrochlorin cobaltochelatase
MPRNLTHLIASWTQAPTTLIGQIAILRHHGEEELFELRHADEIELPPDSLVTHQNPEAARELSFTDQSGEYRPLKTAPTLRRGWRLVLQTTEHLRIALDHFYPAMTALYASLLDQTLRPVPLRETLDRQTGMYAATKRLTESEAHVLVCTACDDSNCLKKVLWTLDGTNHFLGLPEDQRRHESAPNHIPLLCHEACNILVAKAREVVKKRERAAAAIQPATP